MFHFSIIRLDFRYSFACLKSSTTSIIPSLSNRFNCAFLFPIFFLISFLFCFISRSPHSFAHFTFRCEWRMGFVWLMLGMQRTYLYNTTHRMFENCVYGLSKHSHWQFNMSYVEIFSYLFSFISMSIFCSISGIAFTAFSFCTAYRQHNMIYDNKTSAVRTIRMNKKATHHLWEQKNPEYINRSSSSSPWFMVHECFMRIWKFKWKNVCTAMFWVGLLRAVSPRSMHSVCACDAQEA